MADANSNTKNRDDDAVIHCTAVQLLKSMYRFHRGSSSASNAGEKENLARSLEDKLQILDEKPVDVLEGLTPNVRKRVEVLRDIQRQHDELKTKYFEERAALEAKYQNLYDPLYSKRYEIVSGLVEVEGVTNKTEKEASTENKPSEEKGVPNFWLIAMKNNYLLAAEIQECDEEALKFLKDVKWCKTNDPTGFKLEFFFDPNPYFKNPVLTKEYHMEGENDPILEKAIGTAIEWHPGKCLTQKILKKKQKKRARNTKPITNIEKCLSFFNFFSPPQIPEDNDEIDDDVVEQLHDQLDGDHDNIGSIIRDRIIPHAVSWFTGEAARGC